MNIKTTLKLSVTAAALFAIAAPVASPANAADDTLKSGNKNILTVSGQIVRALWWGDDGQHDQLFNSAGNSTQSRVRWVAAGTISENVTAGALFEIDIPDSEASGNQGFTATTGSNTRGDDTAGGATDWSVRHEYIWVNHKKFGKLSLGQTDAAANGNTEANLSGISGTSTPGAWVWQGGGIGFLETGTVATGSATGITVGATLSNLDFTSRTDVIRYDTPKFMGLGLAFSLNGDGGGEVGARYSGKFGPVNVVVLAGYSELSGTSANDDQMGGSIAVLHSSGLNATLSAATIDAKLATRKDANNWGASVGYRAKIVKLGGTDFRAVYNKTRHLTANGAEADAVGFDINQSLDSIGGDITLVYRNYDYENNRIGHTQIDSVDVFGIQALFKF